VALLRSVVGDDALRRAAEEIALRRAAVEAYPDRYIRTPRR
jgi:hypothetical protein